MPTKKSTPSSENDTTQAKLAAPMAYQWRVMQFYPKGKPGSLEPGTIGQFLAYIDARDVYNRLDEVLGIGNWEDAWELVDASRHAVKVSITAHIDDRTITKSDVGYPNGELDTEPLKSAISDGIKRAAVHFGIGRFLYAMEPVKRKVDKWGRPLQPIPTTQEQPDSDPEDEPGAASAPAPAVNQQLQCEVCGEPVTAPGAFKSKERYDGHIFCFKHQLEYKRQHLAASHEVTPATSDITESPTRDGARVVFYADRYIYKPTGEEIADGPCDLCGNKAYAKNFAFSLEEYDRRLCWNCQTKVKNGELVIEPTPETEAHADQLPF